MSGYHLILFGILLLLTPVILMLRDGVESEADVIHWILQQPLQNILMLQAMVTSGAWLVRSGVLMINLIR